MELLQTIPGVEVTTSQVLIAETGADMSQFRSAAHLAARAGSCPGRARIRRPVLVDGHPAREQVGGLDAGRVRALRRPDEEHLPGTQYRQIAARRGAKRAAVAVAHSILVSAFHMLDRDEVYRDTDRTGSPATSTPRSKPGVWFTQLERLGHTVALAPTS